MAIFLFLLLAAIVLGLVGAVAEGLFYLLIIGIVIFVADIAFFAVRTSRRSRGRPLR
ncbi:hypothetical protein [Streptomyces griseoruber]|uniref:hypothetical protein n=1 Tax=Streptomyces griseoruber TaxID=1943 RepID=UPI000A469813|nr:hypothetical protein [Streptomyces griseoruber]